MTRRYVTKAALTDLAAQLTDRDLAILKSVSSLRFMSGQQLTRWHFGDGPANARAARRALLRLIRLGCLARLPRRVGGVRAGSAGFVYTLHAAGQAVAALHGWQPEQRRRRSWSPGTLFLNHTLQVAELHTRLIEGDRAGRFELLELRAEPSCWRSYGDGLAQPVTLKPDSYVRLGVGAFEDSYFVEIDLGSEGSGALLRQLRAYVDFHRAGQEQRSRGVFPRVLWSAPDEARAAVLGTCIGRLPPAERELFVVAEFAEGLALFEGQGAKNTTNSRLSSLHTDK